MPTRDYFVSFPECDGGHAYLAARAMLNPRRIAHLVDKNTVWDSLTALATGQANIAVVPIHNSITQWERSTLDAVFSGHFELCAEMCVETRYVLVANTDLASDFARARDPVAENSPEELAKIYVRHLARIFASPDMEEQSGGQIFIPQIPQATIELTRNPMRMVDELLKDESRWGGGDGDSSNAESKLAIASNIALGAFVAAGFLDAPGDPDAWDQPGSLAGLLSLLRKMIVLLNVYSLAAVPQSKTHYLMLCRRGGQGMGALMTPKALPERIMGLILPRG